MSRESKVTEKGRKRKKSGHRARRCARVPKSVAGTRALPLWAKGIGNLRGLKTRPTKGILTPTTSIDGLQTLKKRERKCSSSNGLEAFIRLREPVCSRGKKKKAKEKGPTTIENIPPDERRLHKR